MDKLFDNKSETKMLLKPRVARAAAFGLNITVSLPSAMAISAYSITSANDFEARDPASWRLSGRTAAAGGERASKWVTLDEQAGFRFQERYQPGLFMLNGTRVAALAAPSFSEYMLTVTAVADPHLVACETSFCTQFSGFALHRPGEEPEV